MMDLNRLRYWLVLFQALSIYNLNVSTVLAQTNVNIDDTSPSIIYSPPEAWTTQTPSRLDYGGNHHLAQNFPDASASFNFTGIAISFLSPLWPYTVTTAISLDSAPPSLLNLTDPNLFAVNNGMETVQSQVVWSRSGLANTEHNLLMFVGDNQMYAIVDGLIYTTEPVVVTSSPPSSLPSTPTSSSSPSSTSQSSIVPSSTPDVTRVSSKVPVSTIAVSSALATLVVLVILSALVWYFRRRRKRPITPSSTASILSTNPSSMPPTRQNFMNNYSNGNQLSDYAAVTPFEFDDGQIRPGRYYDAANIGILPLAHTSQTYPYPHGGYQDGFNSPGTDMHQALGSPSPNAYESNYTSAGGYQDSLASPGVSLRRQSQRSLSRSTNPFDLSYAPSPSIVGKVTPQMMGDGSDPPENPPPSY